MVEKVIPVIFLVSILAMFILFVVSGIGSLGWNSWGLSWWWGVSSALICAISFAALRMFDTLIVATAKWRRITLSSYGKPVPEFALQTAVDIAEHTGTSEVDFYIDQLVVNERTLDPFLVVRCKKDTTDYYLEVWNEPKFKQEREI